MSVTAPSSRVTRIRLLVARLPVQWTIGVGLILAYLAVWALSARVVPRGSSDLDVCFWPAADIAAAGHPLLIYTGRGLSGQCPNANGPLGLLPVVPLALMANGFGWARDALMHTALADVVGAAIAVGMTAAAVSLIRRGRGTVEWPLAAWCAFLLAPVLWISVSAYGHIEQPLEVLFVLLAVRLLLLDRWGLAGIVLGLALLTRTTALLVVVPLVLLPLSERRLRPAATRLAALAVTAAVGFVPFFLADRSHALYSLVTYRSQAPIGGGSLWAVAYNTPWAGVIERADGYAILATVTALSAVVLWRRRSEGQTVASVSGLLTVASVCFPMLAKTTLPYYLFEPYLFGTVWWLAQPGRALTWRMAVPLLLTADALLAKAGAMLPLTGKGLAEGITSSAVLALVAVLVMADLMRSVQHPERSAIMNTTSPAVAPASAAAGEGRG